MRVVLCCGVFDLLHVGHARHLQAARTFGDKLVVAVTADEHVNKEGRPIIDEGERLEMVKSLACVSSAYITRDSMEALERVMPNIFCKGHDYLEKGLLDEEREFCLMNGVQIIYTKECRRTTTSIIERIMECESV